jgi:multiple sugar transport system substrate-binding protein
MQPILRRSVMLGAAGLAGAGLLPHRGRAADKPAKLTLLAHRVHQLCCTEGPGGDATKAWREQNAIALEWVTLDLNAIRDRLMREASLSHTDVNVGFLLNTAAVPEAFRLFEPLDAYMQKTPIEDPSDISKGFMEAFAYKGTQYGIPFRQAVNALHWNAARFAERGVEGPPETIDQFLDVCRKLSYTAKDGTHVYAFGFEGDNYSTMVMMARAFGGDLITEDYKVMADGPGMVEALKLLRALYQEKLLPQNITAMTQNDLIGAMQQGQIAMEEFPFGRTVLFNDPKSSKFPGQFKLAMFPGAKKGDIVSTAEFWGMVIPKASGAKDWSWSLMRDLVSKQNSVTEAINGNGPVRVSTDADPRLVAKVSYAAQEAAAVKAARVPLPAFAKAAQAKDICVEAMQAAMLGMQTPEQAAKSMAQRLKPLMPA